MHAIGIYPGGQSGYPGSKHYNDFIDEWLEGTLFTLITDKEPNDIKGHRITFLPADK